MLSMLLAALLTTPVNAADEPCYEHEWPDRISGDHFWVEWDPETPFDAEKAAVVLEAAEQARAIYEGELGWPMTDQPIVITVVALQGYNGLTGLTQTQECTDGPVPFITLSIGSYDEQSVRSVTAHEVAHAAQYGYMGDYMDSVESWLWWMEGSATWLTVFADESVVGWATEADGYLDNVHLGLHHGLEGFLAEDTSDHMYGTAFLAEYLEQYHGGPDIVRDTWEWGGPSSGTRLFFPDAIAGVGLDFDAVWAEYMAVVATRDLENGDKVMTTPKLADIVELPASGDSELETEPQGLGMNVVRFAAQAGKKNRALQVSFEGDPAVPWHVVLVRSNGSEIVDYVPIPVENGVGTGWISGFHRVDAWLIASPHIDDAFGHEWSFGAELVKDPGPMEGTVTLGDAPESGGCATAPGSSWAIAAAALASLRSRVRIWDRSRRR